jgi:hypothetical protein
MGPVAGDRPLRTVGAGTKGDAEYGRKGGTEAGMKGGP